VHFPASICVLVLALAFTGLEIAAAAVTFTIPLSTLDDVRRLDRRAEIHEVIRTARTDSDAFIFLAAYVTADDARAHHADATGLADLLVVEIGGYLASRGVEAERITGKGMGIDPAIGRAVVVSFGVNEPPARLAAANRRGHSQ
jgi:hypothetical protein